jgi:hypothetical protein
MPFILFDPPANVESAQARHVHVQENKIGIPAVDDFQRRSTAFREDDFIPARDKQSFKEREIRFIIVNAENSRSGFHHVLHPLSIEPSLELH